MLLEFYRFGKPNSLNLPQRRGSALRTVMLRPIHSTSWRSLIALVSSSPLARSTKPKPRLRPDSRSRGREHFFTSPYCPKRWIRSSRSVSQERFPMKMVKKLNRLVVRLYFRILPPFTAWTEEQSLAIERHGGVGIQLQWLEWRTIPSVSMCAGETQVRQSELRF